MGESPFSREVNTPRGLRDPRGTGPVPLGIKQGVCQLPEQAAGTQPCSRSHQRHAASPRGSSSAAVGVGAPRLPLPRQRPGTATVLTSAVSRAVPVAVAAVTMPVLSVPCAAVCGCPTLLGAVPTQTQTVPRTDSRRPRAQKPPSPGKHSLSHAQLLLSPRSRHRPHAHAAIPTHMPLSTCPLWVLEVESVSMAVSKSSLGKHSSWTPPSHSSSLSSPAHSPSQRCHHCSLSLGQCHRLLRWLQLSKEVFPVLTTARLDLA